MTCKQLDVLPCGFYIIKRHNTVIGDRKIECLCCRLIHEPKRGSGHIPTKFFVEMKDWLLHKDEGYYRYNTYQNEFDGSVISAEPISDEEAYLYAL